MKPILTKALHTLWQSFAGIETVWYASSGANLWHQVNDVSSAERFALGALGAAAAALFSAAKTAGVQAAVAYFNSNVAKHAKAETTDAQLQVPDPNTVDALAQANAIYQAA